MHDWFNEARYGMFIHWGPYSVAARGEWVLNRELIPFPEYTRKYVDTFLAENYDPREWVRLAKKAGMKYMVLTTRHHDGFCLWPTKTTGFNAMQMGPKRDLLTPFAEAVREAGLKLGFYYSVADWGHADYPDAYARDWPLGWDSEEQRKRFVAFNRAQIEELLTGFGKVDVLWYDGCIPEPVSGGELNPFIKSFQPHILINERNGQPYDFRCSEQAIKPAAPGENWEASMTLNENWGYHAGDESWKSPKRVIQMLLETAAGAGNLALNIGPRADGTVPEESVRILTGAGDWLERNGGCLPNSTRSPFSWNNSGRLTTKGNTVYVHLFHSPGDEFTLGEIKNQVLSARYLATGEPVEFKQCKGRLFLKGLPVPLPDKIATTIALEVEGEPEPIRPQGTFWIPG